MKRNEATMDDPLELPTAREVIENWVRFNGELPTVEEMAQAWVRFNEELPTVEGIANWLKENE